MENKNNQDKSLYYVVWSGAITNWEPLQLPDQPEPEISDLTEARKVLSEIMSKK
jgi:hypothetical protein